MAYRFGDAFVAQFNPSLTSRIYSSYLGGRSDDAATGVAVEASGAFVVVGNTVSANWPTTPNAFQPRYMGTQGGGLFPQGDAFLVRFGETPRNSIAAVSHGATFASGPVAPGLVITLFGEGIGPDGLVTAQLSPAGTLETTLAGTRVLVDGTPAPLVYVSARQSSAIVPYAVAGKTSAAIIVEYRGDRTAPLTVAVRDSAPGLFSADSSGRGPGAILHPDYTPVTAARPADRGGIVLLFGTGEGQTDPPGADGKLATGVLPKPLLPVTVTIGGVEAEVLYAGAAPGLVAGVLQINVKIPENLVPGTHPVIVRIGGNASQTGLTISVR